MISRLFKLLLFHWAVWGTSQLFHIQFQNVTLQVVDLRQSLFILERH